VQISGAGGSVEVMGLSATIDLASAQGSTDLLRVNMGIGADAVLADGLSAGSVRLYLDGGAGDDVVYGSPGDDVLDGGPGDDILNGRFGFDVGMNGEVLFDIEAVVP
jgi:Ca2+-binding RTX toxin-like protein